VDLTHYQRYLPHQLGAGQSYFITFRLVGSLPLEVLARLREEHILLEREAAAHRAAGHPDKPYDRQKRWFGHFDASLDAATAGPAYLNQPAIGLTVAQTLQFYHEQGAYVLLAYCIMPNHVHLVVNLPEEAPLLARTLQRIKSFTARHINEAHCSNGRVWQPESYDHRIRSNRELQNVLAYVVNNPVKAGLVADWQQWPFTFLHES
jgi:REP element-mobilizing transposase RayT